MKKELLSPVGNWECLEISIKNGCDAVYLAGTLYGARKFAKNFSYEELEEAVKYSHLYGVKVYVTVNTIIYEKEIEDCLKYIEFLYNIGVDAIIVQDLGLIMLVRKYFPDLEIHASTQAHTHNIEQIKLLESLGVKRVVLARELSLDEIKKMDTKMELEVFVHGALCICYSGQCLFSSFLLDRSGNRGECAGLCRCLYSLKEGDKNIIKDKYLLSPKELNTINYIEELKNSPIYSFKIEGRMKSPEYVGYVTHLYRKILDSKNGKLSQEEIFNLKSLYNRGFTKGYLFNNSDKEFISLNSSNHQGVEIGEVVDFRKDRIKIKLSCELNQNDAIRLPNNEGMYVNYLYDLKGNLINKGNKNEIVYVQNKVGLKSLGKVFLTVNKKLGDKIKAGENKKIRIDALVRAKVNENLVVSYSDGIHEVLKVLDRVEIAKSSPISKDRIKKIVSELGNTPFVMGDIRLEVDNNIFIPVKVLKEIRRGLVEELIIKREEVKRAKKLVLEEYKGKRDKRNIKFSVKVRGEEQLKAVIDRVDYVYVTSEEVYQKYKNNPKVYLVLDRVMDKFPEYQNERLVIGESGSLKYCKDNEVVSDYYLNVVNKAYMYLLKDLGVKRITVSPEVKGDNLKELLDGLDNEIQVEVIGYGSIEYMIMKYDLIENMNLKSDGKYELEDRLKRRFRIYKDRYTHLMADKKIDLRKEIDRLEEMVIDVFRIELFEEDREEIDRILKSFRR